jgi:glycosyltransferase involved in cell wall biosynthesis
MKLAWNAIVKNERAVIDRCVASLLPHIDHAIVVDTGSTDGTPERIMELFAAAGKAVELHYEPFKNFEQARNAALRRARESNHVWDYLLLADADMEFKVNTPDWFNGGKELAYDLRQRGGSLGYYNRRLLSRAAQGWYVGVTHEYLDVPATCFLDGAEFIDHADGANRPDKLKRDIALLETALATETRPGLIERYNFYLAGSYYDLGQFDKAAKHYKLRTTLGGFAEEQWYAQMRYAMCCREMGLNEAFVSEMLKAYQARPYRAEPLYELARFFREHGENAISLLYSIPGMALPLPTQELLFVNEWIYKHGLREEFAICAYYDPKQRKKGADVCDDLVLGGSQQARGNQYWYLEPLVNLVPSFQPKRLDVSWGDDYVPMNPSIVLYEGQGLVVLVRTVNYSITPEGQYEIRSTSGPANSANPIHTRNHLVYLDDELNVISSNELQMPSEWPAPKYAWVIGFEDSRLFVYDNQFWTISTVRELNEPGLCQQVVTPLDAYGYSNAWVVFESHQNTHEKNWMPWILDGEIQFVHRLGSMIKMSGGHGFYRDPKIDPSRISGGSQVIKAEGINIALVHEANFIPGRPNRFYQHRFVTFANDGGMLRISRPFFFHDRQIEFAAGLAFIPEKRQLVASYGIRDCEAWLATMDLDDVVAFIAESGP